MCVCVSVVFPPDVRGHNRRHTVRLSRTDVPHCPRKPPPQVGSTSLTQAVDGGTDLECRTQLDVHGGDEVVLPQQQERLSIDFLRQELSSQFLAAWRDREDDEKKTRPEGQTCRTRGVGSKRRRRRSPSKHQPWSEEMNLQTSSTLHWAGVADRKLPPCRGRLPGAELSDWGALCSALEQEWEELGESEGESSSSSSSPSLDTSSDRLDSEWHYRQKKTERFPDEMFSSDPFPLVPLEGPSTILWSRHHGLRTLFPWWPYLDRRVSVWHFIGGDIRAVPPWGASAPPAALRGGWGRWRESGAAPPPAGLEVLATADIIPVDQRTKGQNNGTAGLIDSFVSQLQGVVNDDGFNKLITVNNWSWTQTTTTDEWLGCKRLKKNNIKLIN